ncbi:MAG: hypothetical protein LBD75_04470 [Candidatus Peribacteria bacterium]|jgi:hypothetical protein|nr:hypothetical protein [Candidatus Peribacteria bacterium]
MSKLDFQITNETGNLRRKNYQDFIKNVYQFTPDTLYSNAILTLTYGSFENIKKQLACIHQEIKH